MWIDTGGTFTDCLAVDPGGRPHRAKVLSSSALRGRVAEVRGPRALRLATDWRLPADFFAGCSLRLLGGSGQGVPIHAFRVSAATVELAERIDRARAGDGFEIQSPEEAPVLAARLVTGTSPGQVLPPMAMRLATTRGTNALLERQGAETALFVTRGFADLLEIGTQQRSDLFALQVVKPAPFYAHVVEVAERLAADGTVQEPLALEPLIPIVDRLVGSGCLVAAVALMHSYRNAKHEQLLSRFLLGRGFRHVSSSAELAPLIKLLPRAETAVVDAYLTPVIGDYLDRVGAALPVGGLHVMTSAGGLVRAQEYRAKDSLLSGPAGGVVGAARAARGSGWRRLIAFDMGGTSTDVARFDGDYEYLFETRVGDARLMAPALAIASVAAGGGSICDFDGSQLKVGPRSAGALPGPACYGAGGPLTLTDVNLLLGWLDPRRFEIPIDRQAAVTALDELAARVAAASPAAATRDQLLDGLRWIANERMAEAIRRISVRRGYDPRRYALVAFGGAGPQHACAVAALLDIATVLVPADAGLLSALGLGQARLERFAHRQVLRPLAEVETRLKSWFAELAEEAAAALEREGVPPRESELRRRQVDLRFAGQESTIEVEYDPAARIGEAFAAAHQRLYGFRPQSQEIEVDSLRVVVSSPEEPLAEAAAADEHFPAAPDAGQRACFDGRWQPVPVYERRRLSVGATLDGPALVFERHSATVVEPGWQLTVDRRAALLLSWRGGSG